MFRKSLPLLVLFLAICRISIAQTGVIEGVIHDAKTKETLVGAQLMLQGTTTGTITNFNGEFRIANVKPGTYDLLVSYISYEPLIIESVKVDGGRAVALNIDMRPMNIDLEGVTVTARRTTHTEFAMLSAIRTSEMVVSGISAQQISRSQDSDAAEVVRRIPGVTIVNDRFIVVRGLSERYNAVHLHNVSAPSMEADVRSFSFDMLPSSQIDRLLIYKSPSPSLPGDFAGGMIKIFTRSIPDRSGLELTYSNKYNHGSSLANYLVSERGNAAWTGLGGQDYFSLPQGFPEDIRSITSNPDALQTAGRLLKNNWLPKETFALPDQSASLTASLRLKAGGVDIGNITTISYSNSKSVNEIFRSDYNAYNNVQNISLPIYEFNDSQHNNNIKLGVLHNWGLRFNENHTIEWINLYNHISSYRYVNRMGEHIDFGFIMNNHAFQQVFRGLYSGQISGQHQFTEHSSIDWTAGLNRSFRDMPDYKQYRSERPINEPGEDYYNIYVPIGGAQPYFMGRFFSEMKEKGQTFSANASQSLPLGDAFSPEFRLGGHYDYMERDFRARNIGYTQAVGFDQGLRSVGIDSLFHPDHINNFGGVKVDEQSNPQDSYDASNRLLAVYLSAHLPFGRIHLSGGVRMERNHRILNSATTEGLVNVDLDQTHWLPSLNLAYHLTDDMLVRAAYGRTLNRPEIRENAPFGFFDFDHNYVMTGFPFLKTAEIDNYDLRIEYYPSDSEVISLAGFYKNFANAIERVFLPGAGSGGSKNFSFGNADEAVIYGIEAEVRKNLGGLFSSAVFQHLSVLFNGTLLESKVEIGSGSRSEGRDTDPRPLQGQSPFIVNAGIAYNNIDKDLQVNILYNIIGKRIYSAGFRELDGVTISYPDVYEMPRHLLDITISKRLSHNLSVKAGVSDILNQTIQLLQDGNNDGRLDRRNDQLLQSYQPGFSVSAGISYRL